LQIGLSAGQIIMGPLSSLSWLKILNATVTPWNSKQNDKCEINMNSKMSNRHNDL